MGLCRLDPTLLTLSENSSSAEGVSQNSISDDPKILPAVDEHEGKQRSGETTSSMSSVAHQLAMALVNTHAQHYGVKDISVRTKRLENQNSVAPSIPGPSLAKPDEQKTEPRTTNPLVGFPPSSSTVPQTQST
jgi:hypothetical protein